MDAVWKTYVVLNVMIRFCRAGATVSHHEGGSDWNYVVGSDKGSEMWKKRYTDCGGVMQSPIDIVTGQVTCDAALNHFDLSQYSNTNGVNMVLQNVHGHTAQVTLSGNEVYLKGGSLPDNYKLEQFHFHFGNTEKKGSEHSLNGQFYPMEAHFVHYQSKLQNLSVAVSHPHGLAVIGLFYQVGANNPKYQRLVENLKHITLPDQKLSIPTFPVTDLLPANMNISFFRYDGSLTTPPCYETVIWSVSTNIIEISEMQINNFRNLYSERNKKLTNNYRPTQKLNQRTVLSSDNNPQFCRKSIGSREKNAVKGGKKYGESIMIFVICLCHLLL